MANKYIVGNLYKLKMNAYGTKPGERKLNIIKTGTILRLQAIHTGCLTLVQIISIDSHDNVIIDIPCEEDNLNAYLEEYDAIVQHHQYLTIGKHYRLKQSASIVGDEKGSVGAGELIKFSANVFRQEKSAFMYNDEFAINIPWNCLVDYIDLVPVEEEIPKKAELPTCLFLANEEFMRLS